MEPIEITIPLITSGGVFTDVLFAIFAFAMAYWVVKFFGSIITGG
jgi:hypothetical protein